MEDFYYWAYSVFRALLAGSLIIFLWLAYSRFFSSLKHEKGLSANRSNPTIRFEIQDGTHQANITITTNHFYIGRDPICEYRINHETISAQHAIVSFHHNQWWVADADSRNGTFLNDLAVEQETVLADNDKLRCGNVTFRLYLEK